MIATTGFEILDHIVLQAAAIIAALGALAAAISSMMNHQKLSKIRETQKVTATKTENIENTVLDAANTSSANQDKLTMIDQKVDQAAVKVEQAAHAAKAAAAALTNGSAPHS